LASGVCRTMTDHPGKEYIVFSLIIYIFIITFIVHHQGESMKNTVRSLLIIAVMAAIALSVNAADNYTYDDDIKAVLQQNGCAGCHSFAQTYDALMSQTSTSSSTRGVPVVYAAKPDSSVLVWRLEGELPDGGSLALMPQGGNKLDDAVIQKVRDWIAQGAPEQAVAVDNSKKWGEIKALFR